MKKNQIDTLDERTLDFILDVAYDACVISNISDYDINTDDLGFVTGFTFVFDSVKALVFFALKLGAVMALNQNPFLSIHSKGTTLTLNYKI